MTHEPTPHSTATTPNQLSIFHALESYDWQNDTAFQTGLRSVLHTHPTTQPSTNPSPAPQSSSDPSPQAQSGPAPSPNPVSVEHITLRARCFYFARKHGIRIDFDAYQQWRRERQGQKSQSVSVNVTEERNGILGHGPEVGEGASGSGNGDGDSDGNAAPYPNTFSHIVELISSGQDIPGIKEVPDTVLHGQGSQPAAVKRQKPWEKVGDRSAESVEAIR